MEGKMKKLFKGMMTILLSGCIIFNFAACGKGAAADGDQANTAQTTESAAASTEAATDAGQSASLSRYDYVADMNGNPTEFTIAQNLKSVKIGISSMHLEITAFCEVDGNVLKITKLAEGNEQFYKGVSAHTYLLNDDGTAVPQD